MAMENGPFISDFAMKTSIHRGFPLPCLITRGYSCASIPWFKWYPVEWSPSKATIFFRQNWASSFSGCPPSWQIYRLRNQQQVTSHPKGPPLYAVMIPQWPKDPKVKLLIHPTGRHHNFGKLIVFKSCEKTCQNVITWKNSLSFESRNCKRCWCIWCLHAISIKSKTTTGQENGSWAPKTRYCPATDNSLLKPSLRDRTVEQPQPQLQEIPYARLR